MALIKSVPTKLKIDGSVVATYTRIHAYQVHPGDRVVDVIALSYADEATRRAPPADGWVPMSKWEHRFTYAELGSNTPTIADIYAAMKAECPEWAGAEDA